MSGTVVYFIQRKSGGPIKIGITRDLRKRLVALQTAQPDELCALVSAPARGEVEKALHQKFAMFHERNEWFRDVPAIHEEIERIKCGGGEYLRLMYTSAGQRLTATVVHSEPLAQERLRVKQEVLGLLRELIAPWEGGEGVNSALDRMSAATGIPRGRVKRIWFGEISSVLAEEYLIIQRALAHKRESARSVA